MNKKYLIIILLLVLVAGSIIFGSKREVTLISEAPTPTPTVTQIPTTAPLKENLEVFPDVFFAKPRAYNVSNVVGYIGGGAFILVDMPEWLVQNWHIEDVEKSEDFILVPNESIDNRDFSDISVIMLSSDELVNAAELFDDHKQSSAGKSLVFSEVILNSSDDLRIYYIQEANGDEITDTYFLDGFEKTAMITFSAKRTNYAKYTPRVREYVQNFAKGGEASG